MFFVFFRFIFSFVPDVFSVFFLAEKFLRHTHTSSFFCVSQKPILPPIIFQFLSNFLNFFLPISFQFPLNTNWKIKSLFIASVIPVLQLDWSFLVIGSFQEYSSNSAKYQITGYYRIDACRNTKQHLFLLYVCMLLNSTFHTLV